MANQGPFLRLIGYDGTVRRKKTRMGFVASKIVICLIECVFDYVLMEGYKATWIINVHKCSFALCIFKIFMSLVEVCGNDDGETRCMSDFSLLLSLFIDVIKSFVNMFFLVEHTPWAKVFRATFVIICKSSKRIVALWHHFLGYRNMVLPYKIGIGLEIIFVGLAILA